MRIISRNQYDFNMSRRSWLSRGKTIYLLQTMMQKSYNNYHILLIL
jgi:hypothetical protein